MTPIKHGNRDILEPCSKHAGGQRLVYSPSKSASVTDSAQQTLITPSGGLSSSHHPTKPSSCHPAGSSHYGAYNCHSTRERACLGFMKDPAGIIASGSVRPSARWTTLTSVAYSSVLHDLLLRMQTEIRAGRMLLTADTMRADPRKGLLRLIPVQSLRSNHCQLSNYPCPSGLSLPHWEAVPPIECSTRPAHLLCRWTALVECNGWRESSPLWCLSSTCSLRRMRQRLSRWPCRDSCNCSCSNNTGPAFPVRHYDAKQQILMCCS